MNDKPIILIDSSPKEKKYETFEFDKIPLNTVFSELEKLNVKGIYLKCKDITECWVKFLKEFEVVEAAGGKVFNSNEEILFIYRFDKWDLPKGHIEKGENKEQAAIREVEEECGVSGLQIEKELETTYHVFYYKEKLRLKVTYWFLMRTNFKGELIPQTEEGITEVAFKNKNEVKLALENTYGNIKLLF